MTTLRERLACLAHKQWTGWMEYLFSKGVFNKDGTWTMPKWAVDRWTKQIATPYKQLSKQEQDSDRKEADHMLDVMKADMPYIEGMCCKKAINKKSGEEYTIVNMDGTNATNGQSGQEMFSYVDINGRLYHRELNEFCCKFEDPNDKQRSSS